MKPCYIQPAPWHAAEAAIERALHTGTGHSADTDTARALAAPLLAACARCPLRDTTCKAALPTAVHRNHGYTGVWAGRLLHDGHDITRPAKGEAA